ncbi:hypothetical protein WN48_00296 [Eufriesea mexicana]|uniref:Uncharacterized protein n=1 Tax=Eufriesea mexicana TaxID=516756 RepID=A0A310SEX7_9HYME|nr:hypothetical protein WN48_00296 [Eufriesea mexicana]
MHYPGVVSFTGGIKISTSTLREYHGATGYDRSTVSSPEGPSDQAYFSGPVRLDHMPRLEYGKIDHTAVSHPPTLWKRVCNCFVFVAGQSMFSLHGTSETTSINSRSTTRTLGSDRKLVEAGIVCRREQLVERKIEQTAWDDGGENPWLNGVVTETPVAPEVGEFSAFVAS